MRPLTARSLAAALIASACVAADGEWSRTTSLPAPVAETHAAVIGSVVYLPGGLEARGGAVVTSAALRAFDAARGGEWRSLAPMPLPLNHAGVTALGGKLYVTGGVEGWPPTPDRPRAVTLEYDPRSGAWRRLADLPASRFGHAMAALDGKLYVVGGLGPDAARTLVYDPAADRWQARAAVPTPRDHLSLHALGGKLYAVGGRQPAPGGATNFAAVEVYDPGADAWSRARDMPTPRSGHAAALVGGRVHAFGGEVINPARVLAQHEAFDVASGEWVSLADMPEPVHGAAAVATGGSVLILGGIVPAGAGAQQALVSKVQVFRP